MPKNNELIPSARRLVGSLRDIGYEFAPAVADLVDNSIEAGATQVDVWVEFEGDESWVRISDNGHGMTEAGLREAMRYGSEREYKDGDLGKFGLGLKTASLSQCRALTVASRTGPKKSPASFSWNLEHVFKTDKWELLSVPPPKLQASIQEALHSGASTVVLWENLDRILGYKHPYGAAQRTQLGKMTGEVEEHLAMVFHRFISGEAGRGRIKITLNGNDVAPWDPFCRTESRTRRLEARSIPIEVDGVRGEVLVEPFVLPHQSRFSSAEAHARATGPKLWNRQQGLYIYRAGRLIQSGGWCGTRTLDEHVKLARVALSFSPRLDEIFKVNVAKMRVELPTALRDELKAYLGAVWRAADAEYRSGSANEHAANGRSSSVSAASRTAARTATTAGARTGTTDVQRPQLYTLAEVRSKAVAVANSDEQPIVQAVFARLQEKESRHESPRGTRA